MTDLVSEALLKDYFHNLVGLFFKILPIREKGEASLPDYMQKLQAELLGCQSLVSGLKNNASLVSLLSILQYLIDNPECSVARVRREVFDAIAICNKLEASYSAKDEGGVCNV